MATRHHGLGGEGPCLTEPCSPPQGANVPHSLPALLWPCRHWALPWLCDPGHCLLGAHMDIWTNRKCYFLWKAGLDSFSPSQQLWDSVPATPTPRRKGPHTALPLRVWSRQGTIDPVSQPFRVLPSGEGSEGPTRRRLPSLQASSIHRGALGHSPSCTPYKITHDASPPSPGTTHLLLSL